MRKEKQEREKEKLRGKLAKRNPKQLRKLIKRELKRVEEVKVIRQLQRDSEEDLAAEHDHLSTGVQDKGITHAVEEKDEFLTPANEEESIVSSEPIVDAESKVANGYIDAEGDDASENADELSKEELGQLVASRWTGEKTEKESGEDFARDNNNEEQSREIPKDTRDGIDDIYALETADSKKNEYDNVEDAFDEDSAVNDHYDFSSHYKDGSVSDSDDELDFEDYNLLEEVKRVTEAAHRTRTKLSVHPYFKLPFPLQNLRRAAASRRTKLLFLPSGLSKRGRNQSRYEQRKKFISWTISLDRCVIM
ncbi:glucosidase 2 subunit beta-like [Eucalyptus grandis]|uniref:glucosidase 2 subunit beta-like n=1 Tax=Eucalyptus grandis TaxID=71139 RepID=UPI00192EA40E|nr:glucosidase 2 subunit beta-like [Eucalyptus grandis]